MDMFFMRDLLNFHKFVIDEVIPYVAEILDLDVNQKYHPRFDYSDIEIGYIVIGIYHKASYLPRDILINYEDFKFDDWKDRILKTILIDDEKVDDDELF